MFFCAFPNSARDCAFCYVGLESPPSPLFLYGSTSRSDRIGSMFLHFDSLGSTYWGSPGSLFISWGPPSMPFCFSHSAPDRMKLRSCDLFGLPPKSTQRNSPAKSLTLSRGRYPWQGLERTSDLADGCKLIIVVLDLGIGFNTIPLDGYNCTLIWWYTNRIWSYYIYDRITWMKRHAFNPNFFPNS